jgi:hypothetical protein
MDIRMDIPLLFTKGCSRPDLVLLTCERRTRQPPPSGAGSQSVSLEQPTSLNLATSPVQADLRSQIARGRQKLLGFVIEIVNLYKVVRPEGVSTET